MDETKRKHTIQNATFQEFTYNRTEYYLFFFFI